MPDSVMGSKRAGCPSFTFNRTGRCRKGFPVRSRRYDPFEQLPRLLSLDGCIFHPTRCRAHCSDPIQARLNGWSSFTDTRSGSTVYGHIRAMLLPSIGDRSATWQATLTISGISGAFGFDLVRKGNYVMYMGFGGRGPPDAPMFEGFVKQVLAKIP